MKLIIKISFIMSVIGSMASQLPYYVVTGTGGYLKILWIVPFTLMLMPHPKECYDKPLRPYYYFVLLFFAYCFVMQAFSFNRYITVDFTNMLMDMAILAVSYKFWKRYGSKRMLFVLGLSLLVCAAFIGYGVYYDYYVDQDIYSKQYAYASKNSLSIILLSAVLFPAISYIPRRLYMKLLWWGVGLLVLYVVIIMRSRSVLGGIAFIYLYFVVKSRNWKIQVLAILLAVAGGIYVYSHPAFYRYMLEGVISAGRDINDIDEFSSGRVHDIEEGWPLFLSNMFSGVGRYYIDSMPIAMLIQYGIPGALIVFSYLFYIGVNLTRGRNDSNLSLVAFLLFFTFVINAIFEAQAPFGPGVKCFILWMSIGFVIADQKGGEEKVLSDIQ